MAAKKAVAQAKKAVKKPAKPPVKKSAKPAAAKAVKKNASKTPARTTAKKVTKSAPPKKVVKPTTAKKAVKSPVVKKAVKKPELKPIAKIPVKKVTTKLETKSLSAKASSNNTSKSVSPKLNHTKPQSEKAEVKTGINSTEREAASSKFKKSAEAPSPVIKQVEEDNEENNYTDTDDMIAEKKAPKTKVTSTLKTEVKEKKPGTRSRVAEKPVVEPVKERRFNFNLKTFGKGKAEFSTEERLQALFQLQLIDSEIDRIRIQRGELPMEVLDLEDEIAGLQTRIQNYSQEVNDMQTQIANKKQSIKDSNTSIKKYESQQMNVKNNREFDSLNKEIEFQQLEIQLSEKRIKEYAGELEAKEALLSAASQSLDERLGDLKAKKDELDNIIAETQKEEEQLLKFGTQARDMIEDRLISAYDRIRENARNGLAVVTIQRDACGGCFNKIPPQRQLDIRQHKKVIVCEHCGRILVDHEIEL